jgi:hypothetical protein
MHSNKNLSINEKQYLKAENSNSLTIDDLPIDIRNLIFKLLDNKNLNTFTGVSKKWYTEITDLFTADIIKIINDTRELQDHEHALKQLKQAFLVPSTEKVLIIKEAIMHLKEWGNKFKYLERIYREKAMLDMMGDSYQDKNLQQLLTEDNAMLDKITDLNMLTSDKYKSYTSQCTFWKERSRRLGRKVTDDIIDENNQNDYICNCTIL